MVTLKDFLPRWCTGLALGDYMQAGAQLSTRDGRKMGNATVMDTDLKTFSNGTAEYATVVTDAGNILTLNENELKRYFYPPVYLMSVATCPGVRVILNPVPYDDVSIVYE